MPRRLSEELTRKEIIDPQYRKFVGAVARIEDLRGRMSEAGRQVDGLFESPLAEAFHG